MNHCPKCKVYIRDEAVICPLCGAPLAVDNTEQRMVGYPDVAYRLKFMRLLIKIALFASVVGQGISMFVDYFINGEFSWSLITGVGLAFGCFTLVYSFENNKSVQHKLVGQLIAAILVILILNRIIGRGDWGLTIGIPSAIAAIQSGLLILLFMKLSHWRIYVMAEVYIVVTAVLMFVIVLVTKHDFWLLSALSAIYTVVVMAAIVVFGGRHATNELKRRFRV